AHPLPLVDCEACILRVYADDFANRLEPGLERVGIDLQRKRGVRLDTRTQQCCDVAGLELDPSFRLAVDELDLAVGQSLSTCDRVVDGRSAHARLDLDRVQRHDVDAITSERIDEDSLRDRRIDAPTTLRIAWRDPSVAGHHAAL